MSDECVVLPLICLNRTNLIMPIITRLFTKSSRHRVQTRLGKAVVLDDVLLAIWLSYRWQSDNYKESQISISNRKAQPLESLLTTFRIWPSSTRLFQRIWCRKVRKTARSVHNTLSHWRRRVLSDLDMQCEKDIDRARCSVKAILIC